MKKQQYFSEVPYIKDKILELSKTPFYRKAQKIRKRKNKSNSLKTASKCNRTVSNHPNKNRTVSSRERLSRLSWILSGRSFQLQDTGSDGLSARFRFKMFVEASIPSSLCLRSWWDQPNFVLTLVCQFPKYANQLTIVTIHPLQQI